MKSQHPSGYREAFLQAASDIAREVYGQARYARDGGIYWTQATPRHPEPTSPPPKPLNAYLYPGATGVALFFALAAKVLDVREYGPLALHIIAPLRKDVREIAADPERAQTVQRAIGGFAGLGSLVYALVRLGDLLGEPTLWDEALEISTLITPERISGDENLEVMSGSAGAILALLTLDERRPEPNRAGHTPLDLALLAARHLLCKSKLWRGEAQAFPLGFCHGTAGIVHALGRLARRTGRTDLDEAAREGWAYIDAFYDAESKNWKLADRGGIAANSWCNGAVGIVLAGIGSRSPKSGPLGGSLAGALRALRTSPVERTDHLCCGNMGRVDALIHAAVQLGDPELLQAAGSLAMSVVERARVEGRYRLMFYPEDLIDVRLFPGSTGIGYSFLRLLKAEIFPSLLVLA